MGRSITSKKHWLASALAFGLCSFSILRTFEHFALADEEREAKIFTAAVYYSVRFTNWLNKSRGETSLNICVQSTPLELKAIENHFHGKRIANRDPQVIRFSSSEDQRCAVLYIQDIKEFKPLESRSLSELTQSGVLTIGRSLDFLKLGGLIALTEDDNRLLISVNEKILKSSPIRLSSELLSIAKLR
ncbi:MAG: YfiR family protein [Bdellovibrionales bacterium]|nr:YfiR family protein [Bdellovibrionales bacterium]